MVGQRERARPFAQVKRLLIGYDEQVARHLVCDDARKVGVKLVSLARKQ